jgi:hypothetical protein
MRRSWSEHEFDAMSASLTLTDGLMAARLLSPTDAGMGQATATRVPDLRWRGCALTEVQASLFTAPLFFARKVADP